MIEFVSYRIRENLRKYLPGELEKMREFWRDYDIAELAREIKCETPRDDEGGCAYYICQPESIAQYPAISIIS